MAEPNPNWIAPLGVAENNNSAKSSPVSSFFKSADGKKNPALSGSFADRVAYAREYFQQYERGSRDIIGKLQAQIRNLEDIALKKRDIANINTEVGQANAITKVQFLTNRANRIEGLKAAYEQHAQQFGTTLNDKAIDILQQHSMINAPTLTSIMTGWEMARASQRDNDRARLDEMQKEFERITQLENELSQARQDMNKLERESEQNQLQYEIDKLQSKLDQELKILEITRDMNKTLLTGAIQMADAGSAGRGSNIGISADELSAAMSGGQGTTQKGTNLSIPEIVRKLAGEKGSKWDHGSIPEGVIDDFTSKVIDYMRDRSFGYGTEREMRNLDEAANNPQIQRAAMRDVMNKWAEPVKDSDMWRFKQVEETGVSSRGKKDVTSGNTNQTELNRRLREKSEQAMKDTSSFDLNTALQEAGISGTVQLNPYEEQMYSSQSNLKATPLGGNGYTYVQWMKQLDPENPVTTRQLEEFNNLSEEEQAKILIDLDEQINNKKKSGAQLNQGTSMQNEDIGYFAINDGIEEVPEEVSEEVLV